MTDENEEVVVEEEPEPEVVEPVADNFTDSTNTTTTNNSNSNTIMPLNTKGGMMYVGPMMFGGSMTQLNVVPDTGSDWLVIESDTCFNCEGDGFDVT